MNISSRLGWLALCAAAFWLQAVPAVAGGGGVSAPFNLIFTELPNETGITATTTNGGSLTVSGETISLVDTGPGNFHGLGSSVQHIYNLLEANGSGAISDQIVVFACPSGCNGAPRVSFTSDSALFLATAPDSAVIEDGTQQLVGSYRDRAGFTVSVFAQSDVDVPEPASLALLCAGLFGLGFARRRRA